ncbi:hypothetical protein [Halotalea alkalilenta]|uniref:hypothetical protein n=1 Tax=Halotalea alkalilenta TaxID=376489 RepID=UPI00167FF259|nr:hypothetical protein [Halotalea alkalilenta]
MIKRMLWLAPVLLSLTLSGCFLFPPPGGGGGGPGGGPSGGHGGGPAAGGHP